MTDEDLHSIAAYLLTVESKQPKMGGTGGTVSASEGKKIYLNHCAACHNMGSGGAPKLGDAEAWTALVKLGIDTIYKNAINGINSMPPRGTCMTCSDNEIKAAVDYLVAQAKEDGSSANKPKPMPKLTMADGKHLYENHCSVCHEKGELGAPKVGDKAAWSPILQQDMDVLFTHAIKGYKGMPKMGACYKCTNADVMAAVKYMAQQSSTGNDYSLW